MRKLGGFAFTVSLLFGSIACSNNSRDNLETERTPTVTTSIEPAADADNSEGEAANADTSQGDATTAPTVLTRRGFVARDAFGDVVDAITGVIDRIAELGSATSDLSCPNRAGFSVAASWASPTAADVQFCDRPQRDAYGSWSIRVQNRAPNPMTFTTFSPSIQTITVGPGESADLRAPMQRFGATTVFVSIAPTSIVTMALDRFLPRPPLASLVECLGHLTPACVIGQLRSVQLPSEISIGGYTMNPNVFFDVLGTVFDTSATLNSLQHVVPITGQLIIDVS